MGKYLNTVTDVEVNARSGSGADMAMKGNPGQFKPLDPAAKAAAPGLPAYDGDIHVHAGGVLNVANPTSVPGSQVAAKVAAQHEAAEKLTEAGAALDAAATAEGDPIAAEVPAKSATRGDWDAYAQAQGMSDEDIAGHATKRDLIAAVTGDA